MKKSEIKLLSLMFAFIFVISNFGILNACAASDTNTSTYEIPELAMTMDIPTSIRVVTKGTKQNNTLFATTDFDYIQTMSKLRENDDYLYGKDIANSYEFELIITENEDGIQNFSELSDKKQTAVIEAVSGQSDVMKSSVYKSGNVSYVELSRSYEDAEGRHFSKEYYTIYLNQDIVVKFSSADSLTSGELSLLQSIVDSIRFPEKKTVNFSEAVSTSELFSFCVIILSFIVLAFYKIGNIKKERISLERKQNRKRSNTESASAAAVESKSPVPSEEKNNSETSSEALSEEKGTAQNAASEAAESESENSSVEEEYEINLEEAIANFEDNSEARRERREQNRNNKKKKFGLRR